MMPLSPTRARARVRSNSFWIPGAILALSLISLTLTAADEKELTRFVEDRLVDCTHVALELDVDVLGKSVEGTARLNLRVLREVTTITLDAVALDVAAVRASRGKNPVPTEFTNDGQHLEVTLAESVPAGETLSLWIDYSVGESENGLHFYGPTRDESDVPAVVWSQGQSVFSSHWFPCFDLPSEKHTSEMVITTKRGYEVSSNGHLVSKEEIGDKVKFHWRLDQPHSTYLMSLIAGEFHITRNTWRGKSIEYWVHPEYASWSSQTFQNTTRMLEFFSEFTGVEYPWDRYAQLCCEGFGGGMENTTATTLGTRSLQDERSLIDGGSDGLISHELAHQWFGDYTTCREWAHIWLNEGFASYFEALWEEEDRGGDEFAYNMFEKAGGAKRGGANLPIVDRAYSHPSAVFDSRAYPKGAWVLHMLRRQLGDSTFREVLGRFLRDHSHASVETIDLRRAIEQVSGRSFERFFYDWTERPGHPVVEVGYKWDAAEKTVRLDVKQTQESPAFHFPLVVEFIWADGFERFTRPLTEKQTTFHFPLAAAPTLVRIDPDQSVLMDLDEKKPRDLWISQLREDPSVVARVRAVKHFSGSENKADTEILAEALLKDGFWGVQSEAADALAKIGGDSARDALVSGLGQKHPRTRRACAQHLASFHQDPKVIAAIRPLVIDGDPSYSVETTAISTYARLEASDTLLVLTKVLERDSRFETIRNAAISALGRVQDPSAIALLTEWTGRDKPRSCRPTAIRALADITKRMQLDDETLLAIIDTIRVSLDDTGSRTRSSAVSALGQIIEPGLARETIPTLEAIAANDSNRRLRKSALETIQAIQSGKPAQVQLADLRTELREAVDQNKALSERLAKLERELGDGASIENATQKTVKAGSN